MKKELVKNKKITSKDVIYAIECFVGLVLFIKKAIDSRK